MAGAVLRLVNEDYDPHLPLKEAISTYVTLGYSDVKVKLENGVWCQTSGLDNLTLKDLNILGRNSSDDFVMEDVDDDFETEEEI